MRRAAFLTSAAGFVVAPRIAHAQSATIRAGSAPVESYALMYFAREQGFFKAAGLDVQIQSFSGGGSVLAALAGGSLDVVCANVGALSNAHSRKIPLSVIAPGGGYSASSPTTVLAIAKTSSLASAKDLNGKTVAVSTLKDLQQASVMRWVDTNGGDAKTLRFIEMPVPEMSPAIQAGRIDAATLLEPSLTAERDNVKVLTDCYDAIAKQFFITLHAGANPWLERNPDVAKRFAAVLRQTADWASKNPAATGEILGKITKIPPANIARMARTAWYPNLDPKLIQPVIDATAHYKFLASDFRAQDLFWAQARA
jgi:NitT/TauT family transport system substrate-binding protein